MRVPEVMWESHGHMNEGSVPKVTCERHVPVEQLKTGFQDKITTRKNSSSLLDLSFSFLMSG